MELVPLVSFERHYQALLVETRTQELPPSDEPEPMSKTSEQIIQGRYAQRADRKRVECKAFVAHVLPLTRVRSKDDALQWTNPVHVRSGLFLGRSRPYPGTLPSGRLNYGQCHQAEAIVFRRPSRKCGNSGSCVPQERLRRGRHQRDRSLPRHIQRWQCTATHTALPLHAP